MTAIFDRLFKLPALLMSVISNYTKFSIHLTINMQFLSEIITFNHFLTGQGRHFYYPVKYNEVKKLLLQLKFGITE